MDGLFAKFMEAASSAATVRLVGRLSMFFTAACFLFLVLTLFFQTHNTAVFKHKGPAKTASALPVPALNLNPAHPSVSVPVRDVFSPASISPTGVVETTVSGQLPAHLKIVGLLISRPSQLIIEDAFAHQTYFIDKAHPQAGISIKSVYPDRFIINYEGQEITIPVKRD
ncbi:MAG: hypothetical protein KGK03_07695 [Candidatus Omnitrophica bacterium]|nr:hypothetical protein [Candidatus Omnitrophota bacterium]MDE2222939.1 hypothetical protein [Candidatus Omnitrophota bacterium]